ncbi:MAG: hypothetical protein ACI97P_002464, partial [Arcticibacterium sp.]
FNLKLSLVRHFILEPSLYLFLLRKTINEEYSGQFGS